MPSPGALADDPHAVPVRHAATVVLARDATVGAGLEVFLQHRVHTMVFAAGATVFPGGGVEDRDREGDRPWHGPGPEWFASRLRVSPRRAAAAVRAAVRELFEESGLLLAVSETDPDGVARTALSAGVRAASDAGEFTIDELLASEGLVLDSSRLVPWDRWTTPPGPRRRYDTLFFVAAARPGDRPDGGTSEARTAEWMRADEAAVAGSLGRLTMMRPTLDVIGGLAHIGSVDALLRTERRIPEGGR